MASMYQQHLTPENISMLSRALKRVENVFLLEQASAESRHIAALMIFEFQKGNITEDGIVSSFLGTAYVSQQSSKQDEPPYLRKEAYALPKRAKPFPLWGLTLND